MSEAAIGNERYRVSGRGGAVEAREVKGVSTLLTVADFAQIMARPKKWVRRVIVNGRLVESVAGGNSPRFKPAAVQAWIDKGCPGLRSLRPSGGRR